MQSLMIMLLTCSVTMSVLALFYMAVTPLLAMRYSVSSRYYSWLFIVIGLIIPFRPQFSNALVKVDIPGNAAMPMIRIGNGAPFAASVENSIPSVMPHISWWQIAAVVWLAGIVIFFAYHAVKHCRFMKLAARWSENITDQQTQTLIQNLKTQMGISQDIGLQFCDSIGSPLMTGFAHPRILLPKADFAKDELYYILKHELVHYKRKDLWYKCLVLIAMAIHWFNPIVYLMAKAIDCQCEFSCDEEVVRNTGADARLNYSETIIGVVRYRSKLKTAFSTNFYGGKKGMKQRIFWIMDMRRKKVGFLVLLSVLILTLGTGFAFAAKAEKQGPAEFIIEDIMVSSGFLPDPAIYEAYSSYGITISDDGKMLLYNGQRVRLFADEHSDAEAFFLDEAGALDLTAVRNADGNLTGIKGISRRKAQEYRSAFFADSPNTEDTPEDLPQDIAADVAKDLIGPNKYEQYSAFGIELSADEKVLNYGGKRVKRFADMLSDGSFETYWFDEAGTANLSAVRNSSGQITAIESISEKQAQEYHLAAEEYEQNSLNGLYDREGAEE